jgi:hypothetical protein
MAMGATSEAAVAVLHWLSLRPSEKTARSRETFWWNRPVRRRDVWVASAAAAIFLISLVPLTRSLRRHSSSMAAANAEATSIASASAIPADSPALNTSRPLNSANGSVPGANPSQQGADNFPDQEPAKPSAPPRSVSHSTGNPARSAQKTSAPKAIPAGNSATGGDGGSGSKAPAIAAAQQTSLRVDVVSDVVDDTLAVYSDDDLILKTALEAAHRGDTLRFSCPIATGDHFLRVILYHGDKEVVVHKENNSELRPDGSNTMEVHVNRRSKMLVKHETSLEIVWPSRTLSSVIPNGAELESGAALTPR